MVLIRSIAFNALFYLNLLVHFVAAIPTLAMPHQAIVAVMKFWAHTNFWLLRVVCGVACEFRGIEKIPTGALLIASKHQSLWETFALITLFADPAFILKRELMWIPFYGWYAWKAGMIPVSRGKRAQALADMTNSARQELNRGRQIIIFPEGTRRAPGAEPQCRTHLDMGSECSGFLAGLRNSGAPIRHRRSRLELVFDWVPLSHGSGRLNLRRRKDALDL